MSRFKDEAIARVDYAGRPQICPVCGENLWRPEIERKRLVDDIKCAGCGAEYVSLGWIGLVRFRPEMEER